MFDKTTLIFSVLKNAITLFNKNAFLFVCLFLKKTMGTALATRAEKVLMWWYRVLKFVAE